MALNKDALRELYRTRAASYDLSANLYYVIGFREAKYRRMAAAALQLKPGDTAVEIGCGTGLNFSYVLQAIGPTGRLVGVDLTDAMLVKAESRRQRHEWANVQLVASDAAAFVFPSKVNGIFSTFALTLVPEYERIIERASQALVAGGRLVVLDLKRPERWPLWIVKLGVAITKPFGVSLDIAERRPWDAMARYFQDVEVTQLYGGFAYIAVGRK